MIAAASENNLKNNELVWRLPNDFKRFKNLTSGHHIIMGRKHLKVFQNHYLTDTYVISHKKTKPEGCM
jgi:dihydrofolate reductase